MCFYTFWAAALRNWSTVIYAPCSPVLLVMVEMSKIKTSLKLNQCVEELCSQVTKILKEDSMYVRKQTFVVLSH